jgi:hypothetical protein
VVTENATTADTLSQGGDDLRRSLQQAGVNLLSLNIEARGDGGAQTHDAAPRHSAPAGRTQTDSAAESDLGQVETTTLVLPGGARVNVLA